MNIRLFVMDVDGTLTDGLIYMTAEGEAMKVFHARDGGAIKQLAAEGVTTAVITGRASAIVERRMKELQVQRLHQGESDKLRCLQDMARDLAIRPERIAYIGDDINDLDCIRWCGFSGCPADAAPQVRAAADYTCALPGGKGAVGEFIAWLHDHT